MNWAAIIWLGLTVAFLIAEASTVTVISLWFAAGSLAALLVWMLHGPLWLQVMVFLVVSAALLIALWPLTKKFLTPKHTATNIDSVIGSTGPVTASIDNGQARGQVKLGAMEWTARSTDGSVIPRGTLVKVDRIEGVKAFVTAVNIPAEV